MKDADQLLEELKDLILSLKKKDRVDNLAFKKAWVDKFTKVRQDIDQLPKNDYDSLDKKYEEWRKENDATSTPS